MGAFDFSGGGQDLSPQDVGLLALATGMMSGRLADGLTGYMQVMSPDAQMRRKLLGSQVNEADLKTQLDAYNLRRLQNWDSMVNGSGAPGATTSPAPMPAGSITSPGAFMSPSDGVGPTAPISEAPQQLTQAQQSGWQYGLRGLPDSTSRAIAGSMAPGDYMKLLATQNAPQTDIEKLMAAQGIAPNSPIGQRMLIDASQKATYIAPTSIRPGGWSLDRNGNATQYPAAPPGFINKPDGQGGFVAVPVTGGTDAIASSAAATAQGQARMKPTMVYNPVSRQYEFSTQERDVGRAAPASAPASFMPNAFDGMPAAAPGATGAFNGDPAQVVASIANIADPQERANALQAFQSQMRAGGGRLPSAPVPLGNAGAAPGTVVPQPGPGQVVGSEAQQTAMSKDYQAQRDAHQQAQITNSYLDNIVQQAQKAAVGPQSDKLQFVNGLLSLVGNERATDAVTANNLLEKYSNQIVSRLGGGGSLNTDSARTIIASAYPNAKMTLPAIQEAAANLRGANEMTMARTNLVAPFGDKLDPVGYNTAARQFDQAADPRIWQLQAMTPQQQAAFVRTLPKNVAADLLQRRQQLRGLGVIQ